MFIYHIFCSKEIFTKVYTDGPENFQFLPVSFRGVKHKNHVHFVEKNRKKKSKKSIKKSRKNQKSKKSRTLFFQVRYPSSHLAKTAS